MNAPGRNDPRIDVVPAGDVPRGAFEYINFILDTSKMAAMTPPVAFGDDEGSQRSGITLIIERAVISAASACRHAVRTVSYQLPLAHTCSL